MIAARTYSKGIIVFLDILGFKEYIKESRDFDEIGEIFSFVEKISHLYNSSNIDGIKIAFFSDSIVLTTEIISKQSVISLLIACHLINIHLYKSTRLFTRGAMCIGEFYHKENIAFGPGIIDAYEEELKAKYIRLTVSPVLIKQELVNNALIEKDENGTYYCNFYLLDVTDANKNNIIDQEEVKRILITNREIILDCIDKFKGTKVYEKYEWLTQPFNNCCKVLATHFKNNEFNKLQISK